MRGAANVNQRSSSRWDNAVSRVVITSTSMQHSSVRYLVVPARSRTTTNHQSNTSFKHHTPSAYGRVRKGSTTYMIEYKTKVRPWRRQAPTLEPTLVTLDKRPAQQLASKPTLSTFTPPDPSVTLMARTEWDLVILRSYKQEIAACNERACMCICHCHAGPGAECYLIEGLGAVPPAVDYDRPPRFHFRRANTSHKRAHRECPKEGREHNRR